ncbi:FCD domain-containing protein [Mangrovicoccus ximenensis]|uniref:FCD domain-containing protein n=1 Tax=Mangrovicoccus ximenensis TaxID=1911570 RepID=UPI000D38EC6B
MPTGAEHGTITVVAGGEGFEVTTLRRDVETDGRRAVVSFSHRIEDDAARRDFTMNALYAEADGSVVDPLGGLPDLRAGRVRFIGSAEQRIAEDYLRILRFFRFTAWYGSDGPDADGLAACAALAEGLERIAAERKGQEMKKLLAAPDPAPALATMEQGGVLERAGPPDIARLRAHLAEEAAAGQASRAQALRLSRRFHMILAEIGGNLVLAKYLEELTLRSSLILGCYGRRQTRLCASGEHGDIVGAIEAGDADRACALLGQHLRHLEEEVEFGNRRAPANALASIFEDGGD